MPSDFDLIRGVAGGIIMLIEQIVGGMLFPTVNVKVLYWHDSVFIQYCQSIKHSKRLPRMKRSVLIWKGHEY